MSHHVSMVNRVMDAPMSRRTLLGLIGAGGLAAALTACAGPGSTIKRPVADLNFTEQKTGTISFEHWRGEDKEIFDSIIAKFHSKNPKIDVEQGISQSSDYQAQALQKLKGGRIGDVAPAFRGSQFESFVKAGLFADLSDTKLNDYYDPTLITAGNKNGAQFGFPYQIVLPMPLANADIMSKAGAGEAPSDWDSYLSLLDAIKSQGIIPISFPGASAGDSGQFFNSMVMNSSPVEDACSKIESGKLKCTDDWFIGMLKKYVELRPYTQDNIAGTATEPAQQLFASGKAAMLASGSYHIAAVRGLGAEFDIDLCPPICSDKGQEKFQGTYNATFILGINTGTEKAGAAYEWIDFLSQPEQASTYANGTAQFSSVIGVTYTNPDLKRIEPWLSKNNALAPRFQFLDLDLRNTVEASCVSVLSGTSPEQAAESAQRIVDERLKARS